MFLSPIKRFKSGFCISQAAAICVSCLRLSSSFDTKVVTFPFEKAQRWCPCYLSSHKHLSDQCFIEILIGIIVINFRIFLMAAIRIMLYVNLNSRYINNI